MNSTPFQNVTDILPPLHHPRDPYPWLVRPPPWTIPP